MNYEIATDEEGFEFLRVEADLSGWFDTWPNEVPEHLALRYVIVTASGGPYGDLYGFVVTDLIDQWNRSYPHNKIDKRLFDDGLITFSIEPLYVKR